MINTPQIVAAGFIKAAMDYGLSYFDAHSWLKYAADTGGIGSAIAKIPSAISNNYAEQGHGMQQAAEAVNHGVHQLDYGQLAGKAVKGLGGAAKTIGGGLHNYQTNVNQAINGPMRGAMDHMATNAIPSIASSLQTNLPPQMDEVGGGVGADYLKSLTDYNTAVTGLGTSAGRVAASSSAGAQNIGDSINNYFRHGPGTNTASNLRNIIESAGHGAPVPVHRTR